MRRSEDRILTTHTGSLPRPPELTRLYVRRARGEAIDAGRARPARARRRCARSCAKQIAAGIDIGNNGEQQREAFFLYVRHRMSGFGGSWSAASVRRRRALSGVHGAMRGAARGAARRSATSEHARRRSARCAISTARRSRPNARDFRAALDAGRRRFAEPFMTAPSPGIIAAAMRNEHYDTEEAYLAALGRALQVEYETIVAHGFLLQLDCPDLALERHISYQDRPLGDFLGFVERVVATINAALVNMPRDRVRLHVCWGNYEGPHDCDVPLAGDPADHPPGQGRRLRAAVRQPAPRARIPLLEGPAARRRPDHRRRRDRYADQLRRASRGRRRPARARRARGRRSAPRAGRHRLRLRHLGRHAAASPRTSSGPS